MRLNQTFAEMRFCQLASAAALAALAATAVRKTKRQTTKIAEDSIYNVIKFFGIVPSAASFSFSLFFFLPSNRLRSIAERTNVCQTNRMRSYAIYENTIIVTRAGRCYASLCNGKVWLASVLTSVMESNYSGNKVVSVNGHTHGKYKQLTRRTTTTTGTTGTNQ